MGYVAEGVRRRDAKWCHMVVMHGKPREALEPSSLSAKERSLLLTELSPISVLTGM
jgi:hypothetical protein